MKKYKINQAFTLVELIVVITILAILGTIGFISLQGYSSSARNSVMISDMNLISKNLELFNLKSGYYPEPDGPLIQVGDSFLKQGYIGDGVIRNIGNINKKPINPLTGKEYIYSKSINSSEYEIATISEEILSKNNNILNNTYANNGEYIIKGNYNGLMLYSKTDTNKQLVSFPSLIISYDNISGTGILFNYYDIERRLVSNGMNEDKYIEFKPKILWNKQLKPETIGDIQKIMDNLILSYSGTLSANLPEIKNFLGSVGSKKYLEIGKNYVNKTMKNNLLSYENITKRNCQKIGGLFYQKIDGEGLGECIREYCYNGFIESGTGCVWSGQVEYKANDLNTYKNEEEFINKVINIQDGKVFENNKDDYFLYATTKIPINTSKTYRLSGSFKSVDGNGMIYFGLRTYDKDFREINANYVLRDGNYGIIESINDNNIITTENLTGWNGEGSYVYKRQLGFYYDGNITKLPDEIYSSPDRNNGYGGTTDSTRGSYSLVNGNEINLNYSIPNYIKKNIIPGVTKVKNHSSGGTWNYYMYRNIDGEVNFSVDITGEYFGSSGEYFSEHLNEFRTGTKYAQIFVGKPKGAYNLEFNNIKLEELP